MHTPKPSTKCVTERGSLFIPNFKRKVIMIKIRSEEEIIEFINLKNLNKLKAAGIEESVLKERTLQGF